MHKLVQCMAITKKWYNNSNNASAPTSFSLRKTLFRNEYSCLGGYSRTSHEIWLNSSCFCEGTWQLVSIAFSNLMRKVIFPLGAQKDPLPSPSLGSGLRNPHADPPARPRFCRIRGKPWLDLQASFQRERCRQLIDTSKVFLSSCLLFYLCRYNISKWWKGCCVKLS